MFMRTERARRKGEGRWYLAGPVTAVVTAAALLALFALALCKGWVPAKFMETCALAGIFLAAMVGGARAAAVRGEGVLTSGAAVGGILFLLLVLAAWLTSSGRVLSAETLRLLICCAGGGLMGGVLMLKRGKSHKRR